MIAPMTTSDPASWLADSTPRSDDLRPASLIPAYPTYVRIENRQEEPLVGLIDADVLAAMLPVLVAATATPGSCFFALWTGYDIGDAGALVDIDHLRYSLWQGNVADATAFGPIGLGQTPNFWWPKDRAWCVASHIDLPVSLVGCRADTATALEGAVGTAATRVPPDGLIVDRDRLDRL